MNIDKKNNQDLNYNQYNKRVIFDGESRSNDDNLVYLS